MFQPYQHGRCSRFKPTIRFACILLASIILICEVSLAAFEYISCRLDGNPLSAVFAGVFTFHSFFTLFYIIGAFRLVECFMVPWLTLQLIFLTTFSLFVIVWWVASLLALFGLVKYYSIPNKDGLSNQEFFIFTGLMLTVVLMITMKLSHILYKGFVNVRDQNMQHYRITEAIERKNSMLKPSYV